MALCAVLALALAPAANAQPVPSDFAGVQLHNGDLLAGPPGIGGPVSAGAGVMRVWLDWSAVEVAPGRYDFSRWDRIVAAAAVARLRILPVIVIAPSFRSSRPASGARSDFYPPARSGDMAAFAAVMVARYGAAGSFWSDHPSLPRVPIHSWQVWNEPNIRPWWGTGPDPAAYTRLLQDVGAAIKACDPTAEVVAAGLPNSPAPGIKAAPFLDGMYRAGAKGAADAFAIHPYANDTAGVLAQVAEMRGVMNRYGDPAPIWVTEFGWASDGPTDGLNVGPARQATLVGDTLGALYGQRSSLGIRGFVYYQWEDVRPGPGDEDAVWYHMGLVGPSFQPKPAYDAFRGAVAGFDRSPSPPDLGVPAPAPTCAAQAAQAGGGSPMQTGGGAPGEHRPAASRAPVPRLHRIRLRPTRFRAARGTRLSFEATVSGTVDLRFQGTARSRAALMPGTLRVHARAGKNAVRLRKRALSPGAHRLLASLVAANGLRSPTARVRFRVIR